MPSRNGKRTAKMHRRKFLHKSIAGEKTMRRGKPMWEMHSLDKKDAERKQPKGKIGAILKMAPFCTSKGESGQLPLFDPIRFQKTGSFEPVFGVLTVRTFLRRS